MAEPKKPHAEAKVTVVENLDDLAAKRRGRVAQHDPEEASEGQAEGDGDVVGIAAALGREVYTWTSPFSKDATVEVRFRRPKGGTRELVARVLGAEQSQNQSLVREYTALASIIELNGDAVRSPSTLLGFKMLKKRVGFVGPDEEDWFDEPIAMFTFAYECAMYPEQLQAAAEIEGSGLSPEDEKRILRMAGLVRPKASPSRST